MRVRSGFGPTHHRRRHGRDAALVIAQAPLIHAAEEPAGSASLAQRDGDNMFEGHRVARGLAWF